jgi:hypothetical protein
MSKNSDGVDRFDLLRKDPKRFFYSILEDIGAPAEPIFFIRTAVCRKGDQVNLGHQYFIPGKGIYDDENDARDAFQEGDRLYRVHADVFRLE